MKKKLLLFACLLLTGISGAWAINVGESVDLSSATWTNQGNAYSTGHERFSETSFTAGKILYRTKTGMEPGFYEVTFKAAANLAAWQSQTGSGYGIAEVYANWAVEDIEVIDQKSCTLETSYTLTTYVGSDGVLEFGLKNIATGGCWYVLDDAATAKYVAAPGAYDNTQNIVNGADFKGATNGSFPGFTIYAPNGGNTWKNGDHNVEYWIGSAANGSFKYYQDLSGLPNGKYKVEASMFNSLNGESEATFTEGGQTGAYVTSNDQSYWALCSAEGTTLTTYSADARVTNNTAQVGVGNKEAMTARWFVTDYVKMYFVEPALSEYATATSSSTTTTADTWYKLEVTTAGTYDITSSADATFTYTTNLLASDETSSAALTANTATALDLSVGTIYFKSSAAATITIAPQSYKAGQDITSLFIKNPGFEDDGKEITLDGSNSITGWTLTKANDSGVYSTTNETYKTQGSTGNYLINHWWTGTPLTQNIGVLPVGVYQLSANVATGNSESSIATLYLSANNDVHSTGYVSSNNKIMGTEYLVFQSDGTTATTIGLRGGEDASVAGNGKITKGAWRESGYWWFKADNFKLTYVNDADATALASNLATLVASNKPYSDITDVSDYTTNYNKYAAYNSSNTVAELVEAINYLTNEYDDYLWQNASTTHPVDVTSTVIAGADCTSNDSWPGGGRTTASVTYYDGTTRTVFTQNHENGAARAQNVTVWYEGAYLLQTYVRNVAAGSYNTIFIGTSTNGESTTIKGVTTSDTGWQNGWTKNNVYFGSGAINQGKTIQISLSNVNNNREADCGEMHLYYIGRSYTNADANKYFGIYAEAPTVEVTDDKPVANTINATWTGTATATFTNPNGLVYANSGQFETTQNIVAGSTCDLVLVDGHPFSAPTAFTAATAKYTMSAIAGDKFGTLVLPFAATTLPGKAYSLSGDVDMATGTVEGTEVTALTANEPVLVTAKGDYTGSSVTVAATSSTSTYNKSNLTGVYQVTNAPESSYVLQNHTATEGVAFYLVETSVAQPSVNPFRAYIPAQSSNVKAIKVNFDDAWETPVTNIEVNDGNDTIYDLSGRRLQKAERGIYIINGKKVLK